MGLLLERQTVIHFSMPKKRTRPPKAIAESVMKEFHHKCAVCGRHEPQIHHLDEDPGNNDPLNLLPLCPNCHLQDAHDPTSPPDPRKLRLFRAYKDPLILDPRFHPIFLRMIVLFNHDFMMQGGDNYGARVHEFVDFVGQFQMGQFYSARIINMFEYWMPKAQRGASEPQVDTKAYSGELFRTVEALAVELLRYQGWEPRLPGIRRDEN